MRRLACRQVQRALDRMADGRLAGGEAEEVQAHLDACEQCEREHAGFLRLRAALADQPRVEMRADALERLQARLAATGRPAGSARLALAGLGLGALIGLAAALPYLMRPTGEPETPVVGAAPVRPSAAAAEHRVSEPMAPGPAAGLRPGEVRHARAPAANKGQSSFRPAGAARKGTVPGGMGGEAPARGLGAGSAIVIVVTPPEPRREASVVLRMAGIDGPDGTPEATVTMVETRGEDGSVQYVGYEYHPVEPEGTATGSGPEPREEGTRDGDNTQGDPQAVTGGPGAEFAARLGVCGAEAA